METAHGLPAGSLKFEIQVKTPQTLLGADGRVPLASMIHGGGGRVSRLHFGTYDYTASLGILGTHQDLRHPVAGPGQAADAVCSGDRGAGAGAASTSCSSRSGA